MSKPGWPGLPIRGDEPRSRQVLRSAFSYINTTTVFKRKQGMSRASPVKRAIPANLDGSPLIKAGPLVVKTFLLITGWELPSPNYLRSSRRETSTDQRARNCPAKHTVHRTAHL